MTKRYSGGPLDLEMMIDDEDMYGEEGFMGVMVVPTTPIMVVGRSGCGGCCWRGDLEAKINRF